MPVSDWVSDISARLDRAFNQKKGVGMKLSNALIVTAIAATTLFGALAHAQSPAAGAGANSYYDDTP
jgi:hypothetical protein